MIVRAFASLDGFRGDSSLRTWLFTIARNLNDGRPRNFVSVDLDMQRHYRPRVNIVQRPTLEGGKGYEITGHHEIMIPLLAWAVVGKL